MRSRPTIYLQRQGAPRTRSYRTQVTCPGSCFVWAIGPKCNGPSATYVRCRGRRRSRHCRAGRRLVPGTERTRSAPLPNVPGVPEQKSPVLPGALPPLPGIFERIRPPSSLWCGFTSSPRPEAPSPAPESWRFALLHWASGGVPNLPCLASGLRPIFAIGPILSTQSEPL